MKIKLLLMIILVVAGFQIYERFFSDSLLETISTYPTQATTEEKPDPNYQCDGRVHCSQMTSCEEAQFFLDNCPGTKMDGDHDGIPCEQQWCN